MVDFDKLENAVDIPLPGYVYVYLSNHTPASRVWFDDLTVTLTEDMVTQATDYYPFGSVMRRVNTPNSYFEGPGKDEKRNFGQYYRYGYQGEYSEEDSETEWNSFELRMYDPVIGRFTSIDPYREFHSPYVGMSNNPVNLTDPTGGMTTNPFGQGCNCIGAPAGAYSSIDADGNIFSVLPDLEFQFLENSHLSITDLFLEWGRGYSLSDGVMNLRVFANDNFANAFRDANVVNQARSFFYKKAVRLGFVDGLTVTNFAGKGDALRGNFGLGGLIGSGTDMVEQFAGSISVSVHSNGEFLTFRIENTTSFESAAYGVGPTWESSESPFYTIPMGNKRQIFLFSEPLSQNRLKVYNALYGN